MKDFARYVDPFLGNGDIELPKPEGIASTWFFLKAQTGNTHPGACMPFGMVSSCPYSGAYVTGYGLNCRSGSGSIPKKYDRYYASGFTHFHHSGTGAIERYYNYFKVLPLIGNINERDKLWELKNEIARPGYYSTELRESGIKVELTVAEKMAFHKYTFKNHGQRKILIDFSNGGLNFEDMKTLPEEAQIKVEKVNSASCHVRMEGILIYVYVEVDGKVLNCQPWQNNELLKDTVLSLESNSINLNKPFGVVFELPEGEGEEAVHYLKIGFSLKNIWQAKENMLSVTGNTFDDVCEKAYNTWNKYLNAVSLVGGTEEKKTIFYTALYHSLIKPCSLSGESPFWEQEEYYVDFATLWDQYKTQLPLVLTLYPDRGKDIVNSMLNAAEYSGKIPHCLLLTNEFDSLTYQARTLFHFTITDAFHRRIKGIDWARAKKLMVKDIMRMENVDFVDKGLLHPLTHTLDLSGACFCIAQIAEYVGDTKTYKEMVELSENWKNAYEDTGLLGESNYYEGGLWNYSFRLLHNMEDRIALSKGRFVKQLDQFFGYGAPPVKQPGDTTDANYEDYMKWGFSLNRFEGFNNEPDIETPYSYIYAGRHDRTAEVVRVGMKYMFTTGRGGLPGNDDSGGLSSCCVWNLLGLFPVTGQPVMLIGSPIFDEIFLKINNNIFKIKTLNNSDINIYVKSASLNGLKLERAYITMEELLAGGELVLSMSSTPTNWGKGERPPSFKGSNSYGK